MPLPPRQLWFLRAAVTLGAVILLVGLWNYSLSGAVRELVAGTGIMLLALLSSRRWRRPGEGVAEK
jgi:hypothetical protein